VVAALLDLNNDHNGHDPATNPAAWGMETAVLPLAQRVLRLRSMFCAVNNPQLPFLTQGFNAAAGAAAGILQVDAGIMEAALLAWQQAGLQQQRRELCWTLVRETLPQPAG
jgi:hypothetical protein